MRDLVAVPADPASLVPALRRALDGSGPAVLPLAPGAGGLAGLPPRVPLPVAVVVRTSGSSGDPKAVALSAGALLAAAAATSSALGGPGEWVLALPGHYVAGVQVIVRAIAGGGEPHPVPGGPFGAEAFAATVLGLPLERRRYAALVGTQLLRLVEAEESGVGDVREAVRSLDAVLIGGGRLAPDLAERADAAGIRVRRTYGATETAGGCVYDGVPLAGTAVRVRDGEVELAGPMLAEGYLGDPARTAARFVDEPGRRWWRTGDTGEWDGERLRVTGRLDDVIVTGGEKVSLGAVEAVVRSLPGLGDAVVVRAGDPEWGEVPVVVTTSEHDLGPIRDAVAERLGRVAAPRRALVVPETPLLASGKPDRRLLQALAEHPPVPRPQRTRSVPGADGTAR